MINNDIIDIQDRFLIDDTHSHIRGFVAAYDENGNRLFLRENMIVVSGRKKILESLRNGLDTNFFEEMHAFLDTNTAITAPSMTFTTLGNTDRINSFKNAMSLEVIEDIDNEAAYSKIFKAGRTYYKTITDNNKSYLVETDKIENRISYYTIERITDSTDITLTGVYFIPDTEDAQHRLVRSKDPSAALSGGSTLYEATPLDISFNPDKVYYYLNDNDQYIESSTLGAKGYFDTDTDYYIRGIKSDIDFDLVECFKITYNASIGNLNGQTRFGSLGLYFPDQSDNLLNSTLFSRVTFPPYSARHNLTFFYYLYF